MKKESLVTFTLDELHEELKKDYENEIIKDDTKFVFFEDVVDLLSDVAYRLESSFDKIEDIQGIECISDCRDIIDNVINDIY